MRFLRHGGIYRSDAIQACYSETGEIEGVYGRLGTIQTQYSEKEQAHEGRRKKWFRARLKTAPGSSSAMSSDRLFLDQVARQQSLSPLHRQAHGMTRAEGGPTDLQGMVHCPKPQLSQKRAQSTTRVQASALDYAAPAARSSRAPAPRRAASACAVDRASAMVSNV